jgi:cytochrome c oxidase subunit 2
LQLPHGVQSALNPQGPHAEAVTAFSWVLFWGAAAVLALVVACTAYALWGPRERRRRLANERLVVYAGVAFPGVVLVALFLYSLLLPRPVGTGGEPPDLRVEVVAHQWWWRVHYLDASGRIDAITANEIRIPTGRVVEVVLRSADVIHSFWVPNLAGKLDAIPGRANRIRLLTPSEGMFRGQCAEYCGGPHAQMAFFVIAHDAARFEQWLEVQRRPAIQPGGTSGRGHELFQERCAACHAVRGTAARGELGPDLTHVASRTYLGAGVLANTPENLAAWIGSSQHIKPGNLMPSMNVLGVDELRAIARYLAALQ